MYISYNDGSVPPTRLAVSKIGRSESQSSLICELKKFLAKSMFDVIR